MIYLPKKWLMTISINQTRISAARTHQKQSHDSIMFPCNQLYLGAWKTKQEIIIKLKICSQCVCTTVILAVAPPHQMMHSTSSFSLSLFNVKIPAATGLLCEQINHNDACFNFHLYIGVTRNDEWSYFWGKNCSKIGSEIKWCVWKPTLVFVM